MYSIANELGYFIIFNLKINPKFNKNLLQVLLVELLKGRKSHLNVTK